MGVIMTSSSSPIQPRHLPLSNVMTQPKTGSLAIGDSQIKVTKTDEKQNKQASGVSDVVDNKIQGPPSTSSLVVATPAEFTFSQKSQRIVQTTNWQTIEVPEPESKEYFDNINKMQCCHNDIDSMQNVRELKLKNGKILTQGEHAALRFYSQHGFSFVNAMLTNNGPAMERACKENGIPLSEVRKIEKEVILHCKMICSALNKLPRSPKRELFRGALLTKEQFMEYKLAYSNKTVLPEKQILSTSTDLLVATRFIHAKKERIQLRYIEASIAAQKNNSPPPVKPEGVPVMFAVMQKGGAKEVQQFSTISGEEEAIFAPGVEFKVCRMSGNEAIPPHHRAIYSHVIVLEQVIK